MVIFMSKPLALKLAPKSLDDVIGQRHLIGKGKILTNLVKNKKLFSMILYGKPGIGKTSIANALVNDLGVRYRFLNAVVNTKKDLDVVIEEAKMYGEIVLIMDEIHRLNKDKQDVLLPQGQGHEVGGECILSAGRACEGGAGVGIGTEADLPQGPGPVYREHQALPSELSAGRCAQGERALRTVAGEQGNRVLPDQLILRKFINYGRSS